MSAVHRIVQALLRSWEQRAVQIAAMVGVVLALGLSALLPFQGAPDSSTAQSARTVTVPKAIPRKRLVGPKRLPAPSSGDLETKAVLAANATVGPIRHGGGTRRLVALTFDDGPGPYTDRIVSVLRATKTPGTFFQVGRNLDENPQAAKPELRLDRVEIADHTYSHHSLAPMTYRQQQDEIISSAATMQAKGEPIPRLFRPPYGAFNQDTERLMSERGMAMILWSVDSQDYTRPGVGRIVENVLSTVKPGAIVLMHDGGGDRSQTAAALPKIIKRLRHEGYGLVTVPQLLLKDPPRKADQDVATPPPGARTGAG